MLRRSSSSTLAGYPLLTIRKHVSEILATLHSPTGRYDGSTDCSTTGLIEIGFAYHDGDVTVLKVRGILLQEPGRSILHFGDNI
jgi:hypothetical protein